MFPIRVIRVMPLPPYSIQIRGTGISDEFGGTKVARTGRDLVDSLIRHADLRPRQPRAGDWLRRRTESPTA
jgi:hypothetical protein